MATDWPLQSVLPLLLGEILDVERYGQYGGKLCLLRQGWHVKSSWTQPNLACTCQYSRNSYAYRNAWLNCLCQLYALTWGYFWTNMSRHDSLEECPILIWQPCAFSCGTPQFTTGHKLTTSDWLIVSHWTVGNCCNSQPYTAAFNLSITHMLVATYTILTWSQVDIAPDFPFLFVIFFLSCSTPPNNGYINT